MADEQVQDTETQVQDTTPPPDAQDVAGGDDGNGKDNLTPEDYKVLNEKLLKERRAANKEAVDAKKKADALAAKVKKYEDEKKTEQEKLEARAKEAEEAAAAAKAEAMTLRHKGYAQDAGVLPQYRDFAVSQFAKEEEADPAEWFKTFKETHPAMFSEKQPAAATAKGGANAPTKPDPIALQIAEHEEAIKTERDMHKLPALKRSLRYLKKKQAETKGA